MRFRLATFVLLLLVGQSLLAGMASADNVRTVFGNSTGQNLKVDMCDGEDRTVSGGARVNRVGTADFAAGEVITITVTPSAAAQQEGVTTSFPEGNTMTWAEADQDLPFTVSVPGTAALATYKIDIAATGENENSVTHHFNLILECDSTGAEDPDPDPNSAPVITELTAANTAACTARITVEFTDDDEADTHSATVAWGDNTDEEALGVVVSGFTASHGYTEAGTFNITVTVSDGEDSDTESAQFTTMNNASGFLAPIPNGSNGHFKTGSTIPVKMTVTDCGGDEVDDVIPILVVNNGAVTPVSQANLDAQFRWSADDEEAGKYIYNLNTRRSDMEAGDYTLAVVGGNIFAGPTADITLRK